VYPTYHGEVSLTDPTPDQIDIRDIAHALSMCNRFAGMTRRPYSVAQHSLICSYLVPPEFALHALLHDAQEAYLGDWTSPVKALLGEAARALEGRFERVIAEAFGLTWTEHAVRWVKDVDLRLRRTEARCLLPPHAAARHAGEGFPFDVRPYRRRSVERMFLSRFDFLEKCRDAERSSWKDVSAVRWVVRQPGG
jgi:hypothetical protein